MVSKHELWGKTVKVRGLFALIEDLKYSKNRDRVKSTLIKTALMGDPLYMVFLRPKSDIHEYVFLLLKICPPFFGHNFGPNFIC